MNKFWHRVFSLFALLLAVSFGCGIVSAQRKTKTKQISEPKYFNAETPIRRGVKIPQSVLQQLENNETVANCSSVSDDRETGDKINLSKYFKAAQVELDGDGKLDIVVQPEPGACLSANTAPFWIFLNTGKGYQLVFHIEALGFSFSQSKTNGLHNIETGVATAFELSTTVFKFNGEVYEPKVCTVQNFKTKRTKRVACSEFGF